MVEQKAAGEEVVTQPPVEEKPGRVVNLMAALEASLDEARKGRKATAGKIHHHSEARRRKSA